MHFLDTGFPGLLVIEPKVFEDERGYFYESYNARLYRDAGIDCDFLQDNQSKSSYGVIRGLHYQLEPHAQAKLVRVISGEVLDVVLDLRKGSPRFGESFAVRLSAENKKQLFIPRGFAHGFSVLSEEAVFFYKCDGYYEKNSERGIRFDDPDLSIDWMIPEGRQIVSEKDQKLPFFKLAEHEFKFQL